jgi:hypothetical protein
VSQRVLALDLATITGWARHEPGMARPFFGAFRLPGKAGDVGRRADYLERWLITMHERHHFTHIVFEAQHVARETDIDTVYMLIALGGIVDKIGFQRGALTYKIMIQEWRKHFLGRGAGFKRDPNTKRYLHGEDPKELAIQRCAHYGWFTDLADAAEACGILDFFLSLIPDYDRPWRDAALLKAVS